MAVADIFVEWFPLLFVSSFILSGLIFEARERGHLKLGREPNKGMIVGLLLILGFNLILFLPISLILLMLSNLGSSSLLETALWALMTLYYIIPSIFSGVIAYGIIRGLFNGWGIGLPGLVTSGTVLGLLLLSRSGWLAPALPWIMESLVSFVGFGMGWIFIMVIFSFCLAAIAPKSDKTQGQAEKKRSLRRPPSQDSALRLLVGLGRRTLIDESQEALAALKGLAKSQTMTQSMLLAAARQAEVDLKDTFSSEDIHFAQHRLEPLTGRFGKLTRRSWYFMVFSAVVSPVSAVITVASMALRSIVGLVFIFPAIMLPVIAGIAYQETSSYRPGRFGTPPVNLYNSYLLTESEFRRKSRSDSFRVVISLGLLLGVIAYSLFGNDPDPVWATAAGSIAVIVAYHASKDRSVALKRLSMSEIVERSLEYLGAEEGDEAEDRVSQTSWTEPPAEPEPEPSPIASREWKQELQMKGHSDFADKVEKGAREAYEEHTTTLYFLGIGGALVMVGSIAWLMTTTSTLAFMSVLGLVPMSFVIVGAPIFAYGAIKYLRARPATRFSGLTRKQLTTTISLLDQDLMGVDSFGSVYDRSAPSEYQAFGMSTLFRNTFLRQAMVKVQDRVPWNQEYVDTVWKTRSSYPKLEGIALFISMAVTFMLYILLIPVEIPYFPAVMKWLIVGSPLLIDLAAVWGIITYYREKRILEAVIGKLSARDPASSRDTLDSLLNLLRFEFQKPLRLLLVGNYEQVSYTGRTYFTTEGVEAREAVLIPL